MRILLGTAVAVALLVAGCSSSAVTDKCPEEYGPEYAQAYKDAKKAYESQTGEKVPDADRDCVPDAVEQAFGTDPNNATSYPPLEDLAGGLGFGNQTDNETKEPLPYPAGQFTIIVSGGDPGAVSFTVPAASYTMAVPAGVKFLLVEAQWNDPVFDLDLHVQTPANAGSTTWDYSNPGGSPGAPDSPHSVLVTDPGEGEWVATVFSKGAAVQTTFTLVATAFFGEVPEGYTALA